MSTSVLNPEYCVKFDPTVGVGTLGSSVPLTTVRDPVWMNLDNNIRSKQDCNSQPIGNPARPDLMSGPLLTNYYVNETDRGQISPNNETQINLTGRPLWNNLSFLDEQRVTTKETTEYAYAGNAQRQRDGTEFWTYKDTPRVTTKETTEYAYAGNAQRQKDGTEFWTYKDTPRVTNKETTEYAYAGNPNRGEFAMTSYNQYTGFSDCDKKTGSQKQACGRTGGADTFAIRGTTLVKDWVLPAGRSNILQDADNRIGKIDFGTFGNDENFNGPGTIDQAVPDGTRFQYKQYLATPHPSPNKLIAIDDRQLAVYQIQQLKENPLSIYTSKPTNAIPGFECMVEPSNFATMVQAETSQPGDKAQDNLNFVVPVYDQTSGAKVNPNAQIVYNETLGPEQENKFLVQQQVPNNNPSFTGLCYSGQPNLQQPIAVDPSPENNNPSVYGPLCGNRALDFSSYNLLLQPS